MLKPRRVSLYHCIDNMVLGTRSEMDIENGPIRTVVIGVASWSATFIIVRKILAKRSFDFCNRVVSLIHVGVALWLCSASVQDWHRPLHPLASRPSPLQIRALAVSLSYFIYDFICSFFDSSINLSNCVHHLVSIFGLGGGIVYHTCGSELISCLWLMEISNPFMHMRELVKEFGLKDSTLSLINDICFALIFTFARLIIGPYLVFVTITSENPMIIKVTSFGLQVVSVFWFYKIARMVQHKVSKAKMSQKTL